MRKHNPLKALYSIRYNPRYWNSVYITLRLVLLYGPYTFFTSFKPIIRSQITLIGVFIAALARWVGVQLLYLFIGLAGFIVMTPPDDTEE